MLLSAIRPNRDFETLKIKLIFSSFFRVPYGPDLYGESPTQTKQDRPFKGYGYGMASLNLSAYDSLQKYFYAVSGEGFVNVLDWSDPTNPFVTTYSMDMTEQEGIEDIKVS